MAFKTIKHKIPEKEEVQDEIRIGENVYENNDHGTISIQHAKEQLAEAGMSLSDKRDRRIDNRLNELEKIGLKRGVKRKLFSVIGITLMFVVTLLCMYLCFMLLSDIINITGQTNKSIIEISNIEIRK